MHVMPTLSSARAPRLLEDNFAERRYLTREEIVNTLFKGVDLKGPRVKHALAWAVPDAVLLEGTKKLPDHALAQEIAIRMSLLTSSLTVYSVWS